MPPTTRSGGTPQYAATPGQRPTEHRRNKSSSVLKSIMVSKQHKRSPSDGTPLPPQTPVSENSGSAQPPRFHAAASVLPPDHPHNAQRVLSEIHNQRDNGSSPKKTKGGKEETSRTLHKKSKSTVSLKSLGRERNKDDESRSPQKNRKASGSSSEEQKRTKKTKSSTNLAAMFSKSKSPIKGRDRKAQAAPPPKDQENTTPPSSAVAEGYRPPIWAQFTAQPLQESSSTTTTTSVPLNDRRSLEDEIALYTPHNYSEDKQRNFHGRHPPSLVTSNNAARPKSCVLPNSKSASSFLDSVSRKISSELSGSADGRSSFDGARKSADDSSRPSIEKIPRDAAQASRDINGTKMSATETMAKRGSRVMAAVAAFNHRSKPSETSSSPSKQSKMDPKALDEAFEELMDSRNIPNDMREKLRGVTSQVKEDFLMKNQIEPPSPTKMAKLPSQDKTPTKRPTLRRDLISSDGGGSAEYFVSAETPDASTSPSKRSRPRSRTFTFNKGDPSPSKKHKADAFTPSGRPKSIDLPKSPSSRSLASLASPGGSQLRPSSKRALPEEFVKYLRKEQRPETVEVGKVHKLRLLLRNETVAWVDDFIQQGGMTEIIGLLHRIMKIEWREAHEDALLHESLLCLKGLCTTDLALTKLHEVNTTLFPALLGMLFDEERKGPAEFTTRGIIINLLFAHLAAASIDERPERARTILAYLSDPRPAEDAAPLPFILEMRRPRPYRVWGREIANVTKEVFWIFMHQLNVVALPKLPGAPDDPDPPSSSTAYDRPHTPRLITTPPDPAAFVQDLPAAAFAAAHFPRPRAPVPAAPYVGGVEWDTTHYLAAHLDLVNGILASLPTREERTALREDLRASGFEKLMGVSLRTCKEKFYGHLHDALRDWVAAAVADGWPVRDVRMGPRREEGSPRKSPRKAAPAPVIELPGLGLGGGFGDEAGGVKGALGGGGWI